MCGCVAGALCVCACPVLCALCVVAWCVWCVLVCGVWWVDGVVIMRFAVCVRAMLVLWCVWVVWFECVVLFVVVGVVCWLWLMVLCVA